ncbi:hypothetical protein EYF80_005808 [Liparis tanakae]|uniref:Uncharacterized protein n=1 Tax=Liparis tanakae TaxID=230148 RepID=A0A4Z2J1Q1_9TELE|nr:hypothetical protein EYF80_005808 [Liparis tanakae]
MFLWERGRCELKQLKLMKFCMNLAAFRIVKNRVRELLATIAAKSGRELSFAFVEDVKARTLLKRKQGL